MSTLLATYTDRARTMSVASLIYAIQDVMATLKLWVDEDPTQDYQAKLWAEFDAYTVELQRRRKAA